MTAKGRIEELDVLKGIAIILMVLGHSGFPETRFLFLFHMAVFFIASGWTHSQGSEASLRSVGSFIRKKIIRLWLPFFVWQTVFVLLNNWFLRINILTDNPELFAYTDPMRVMKLSSLDTAMTLRDMGKGVLRAAAFFSRTKMGGTLWFLQALFLISIAFCIVNCIADKLRWNRTAVQAAVSAAALVLGWAVGKSLVTLHGIDLYRYARTLSCYHLYFLGTLARQRSEWFFHRDRKRHAAVLLVSFAVLTVMNLFQNKLITTPNVYISIDLANNDFPNPLFLLAATAAGWMFLCSLSCLAMKTPLKGFLILLGKNTMSVMIFHYLAFKIVSAAAILLHGLPWFTLAAYPYLYGEHGLWWAAYTAAGVLVPLLIGVLYHRVRDRAAQTLRAGRA